MARTNIHVRHDPVRTHEGAPAMREGALKELQRTLSTCLMFENTFYEGADSIAQRIYELSAQVKMNDLIAEIAHTKQLGLRHAPLWTAVRLATLHKGRAVGDCITATITRADELAEFLSMYWRKSYGSDEQVRRPVTKQMKLGLAAAFDKFNAYQFAKYNRDGAVKLRDVMFLVHPKPKDEAQTELFKQIATNTLPIPNTWENRLSAGEDKKTVWEDMLAHNELGALALLRNLCNMERDGVQRDAVLAALSTANPRGILPFQYLLAWLNAPSYAMAIDGMFTRAFSANVNDLPGTTNLVVDVSGSMDYRLSERGEANRIHAAAALAMGLMEHCQDVRVFTFSNSLVEVQPTRGLGMLDVISRSQPHQGTHLGDALTNLSPRLKGQRVVVITDEQTHDSIPQNLPVERKYILNVAPYQYGVAVDKTWTRINGFSPSVVEWLVIEETDGLFRGDDNEPRYD